MTCDLLLLLRRRRRNHGDSEKNQRDKQLQPHSWMGQPEVEEALQILLHPPNRHRDLQSINNNPPTPQGPERRRRATSRDGDKPQQRENTGDKIFRCTMYIYIHTHTLCMTVQRQ